MSTFVLVNKKTHLRYFLFARPYLKYFINTDSFDHWKNPTKAATNTVFIWKMKKLRYAEIQNHFSQIQHHIYKTINSLMAEIYFIYLFKYPAPNIMVTNKIFLEDWAANCRGEIHICLFDL